MVCELNSKIALESNALSKLFMNKLNNECEPQVISPFKTELIESSRHVFPYYYALI